MSNQGFASFGKDKRVAVSSKGGKTVQEMGTGYKWDLAKSKAASRKGVASRMRRLALKAAKRLIIAGFTPAQLDSLNLSIEEYIYYGGSAATKKRVKELIERMNAAQV